MNVPLDESISFQKSELRKQMVQQLKDFAKQDLCAAETSVLAQERLLSSEIYVSSQTILPFVSLNIEPDTLPLITKSMQDEKTVALPKVSGKNMDFFCINPHFSLESQLTPGIFGIMEPNKNTTPLILSELKGNILVLVPGLAFSVEGNRLGKGGGYYDRFLSALFSAFSYNSNKNDIITAGYCFDFQIQSYIPANIFDIPVEYIITDKRLIHVEDFY